jgi:WD40 repeat protein
MKVWTSRTHDCELDCICTPMKRWHLDSGISNLQKMHYRRSGIVPKPECPVTGHSKSVMAVSFSADGKRIVSGSADHHVIIWNAQSGTEVSSFVGVH